MSNGQKVDTYSKQDMDSPFEWKKNEKIAILGFAPSYAEAPFDDPTFDIAGLNELYAFIPRWDVWFDMHTLEVIQKSTRDGKRLENLANMQCPVYMRERCPQIPNSVQYPLAEMTHYFFGGDTNHRLRIAHGYYRQMGEHRTLDDEIAVGRHGYWTNSVSMMIALAIYAGYKTIHVYGVDMASDREYQAQRPSCEYFLGFARGRGIDTYVPDGSDLLKARYVYGYEEKEQDRWKAKLLEKRQQWQQQLKHFEEKRDEAQSAAEQFSGAIQAQREIHKLIW